MVRGKNQSRLERDNVDAMAIYYAAAAGYYDTRVDAPAKPHITFAQVRDGLPSGATHRFTILVDGTGYQVTRYEKGYVIESYDTTEAQQRERQLRKGVLEKALHHFTDGHYIIGSPDEERNTYLVGLLAPQSKETLGNLNLEGLHPVVQDEPAENSLRRWSVTIGTHRCVVGLVNDSDVPEFAILP